MYQAHRPGVFASACKTAISKQIITLNNTPSLAPRAVPRTIPAFDAPVAVPIQGRMTEDNVPVAVRTGNIGKSSRSLTVTPGLLNSRNIFVFRADPGGRSRPGSRDRGQRACRRPHWEPRYALILSQVFAANKGLRLG